MKREYQIDVSMTGVESLERDQGGYKYLYCELKYMHQNILENILEPSRTFQFQKKLLEREIMYENVYNTIVYLDVLVTI